MKKLKIIIYLTLLLVTALLNNSIFCQQDVSDKQVIQFSTGKDKISFYVLDYETSEPLIGAEIYSFEQNKIVAITDIDGIAITEKVLKGNLEVSYIGYYPECFKLNNDSIDSVRVWLNATPPPPDLYVEDTSQKIESPSLKGESDARLDLNEGNIQLLNKTEPSEEQNTYAKHHGFKFKFWEGSKYYKEAYNEVVIDFLNKKFEKNIAEELRRICWRNYQP